MTTILNLWARRIRRVRMAAMMNFTDFNYVVYTTFCVESGGVHCEFA